MNGDGMGILTQAFKAKLWLEITCNGRNKLFYYMYVESWCIFHFLTERWEDFVENVRKIKYFEHSHVHHWGCKFSHMADAVSVNESN